jgi:hypothetical protein
VPGSALKLIREHAWLAVMAAIGLLVGADYAASLLFAPARAVMHDGRLVFFDCNVPGDKPCVADYEYMLGNTGRQEESVVAAWPVDLDGWSRGQRVLNISADEPRAHDPEVNCKSSAELTECNIERLAPGTLLILNFRCMPCHGSEVATLGEGQPEIRSVARVYRGDPRVSAIVRRLQVLLY